MEKQYTKPAAKQQKKLPEKKSYLEKGKDDTLEHEEPVKAVIRELPPDAIPARSAGGGSFVSIGGGYVVPAPTKK